MKHKFTFRESVLLAVAAVMLLAVFYYIVVYKNVENQLAQYDTTDLVTEQTIASQKSAAYTQMKKAISSEETKSHGTVEPYNNLANEVNALGAQLNGKSTDIRISWADPVLTDTTVRRVAQVSCNVGSYAEAESLVRNIENLQYRCIITDLTIDSSDTTGNTVSVSMTVTFFETTDGAASTEGLTVSEDDTAAATSNSN
jgi:hypothetical protein